MGLSHCSALDRKRKWMEAVYSKLGGPKLPHDTFICSMKKEDRGEYVFRFFSESWREEFGGNGRTNRSIMEKARRAGYVTHWRSAAF